jgi:carbamoyl-phosphate synthase small subunit
MGGNVNDRAILALADGRFFEGRSIGASGSTTGEVVFNTAMTGYQEILSDPSYSGQIVTLTYPHIGNTGTNAQDMESNSLHARGLVIRDLPLLASSWRADMPLDAFLRANNVCAIADIDTRSLTRLLREQGAQNGCIMTGAEASVEKAIAQAKACPLMQGQDLAKVVSTENSYTWDTSVWNLESNDFIQVSAQDFHVVAYDYGVKQNILRILASLGCKITVVPATTSASEVLALKPDGVFLSNGPGDPEPCDYAIEAIRELTDKKIPTFGICLGHQLLALASGAKTEKMKFGHHGANHPVQDLSSKVVMISSQNHGFAVDENSLPKNLVATHRSLFDGSLQGIQRTDCPAFGFQGHPEASPGPKDVEPLFLNFIELMKNTK